MPLPRSLPHTLLKSPTGTPNTKTLSAALSFAGSVPSRSITRVQSAALSFTGSTPGKTVTRGINAALAVTGIVAKASTRILPPGVLSFAGALSKQGGKTLSGALHIAGSIPSRAITRAQNAALAFSGSPPGKAVSRGLSAALTVSGSTPGKAITRAQTAGLTITGSTPGRAITRGFNAAVTFTGSQQKAVRRIFAAASLVFTGALASVKNGGSTAYQQTLTAGLALAGTLQRGTGRGYQAATTFTGTQAKALGLKLSGALSFAGTIPSRAITRAQTAALTFSGSAPGKAISRGFQGAASFTGNQIKAVSRILSGSISLSGAISTVKNGGSHAYQQTLTAGLTLAATIQRSTTHGFTAGLTFTGNQTKAITRKLSATLSASGTLATSHLHTMILTAGLALSGSLPGRAIGKALSASAAFTGSQRKVITRPFTAVLTPVGQISKGIVRSLFGGFSLSGAIQAIKNLIVHKPGVCTVSVAPTYGAALALAPTYTCTVSIDN